MKNALNDNHRSPIGFKVTDNKLMVVEDTENIQTNAQMSRNEAVLKMMVYFHELMERRSKMFLNKEPFFSVEKKTIEDLVNKIYIKYYEKI